MAFCNLHIHSCNSILDSIAKVEDIAARCAELGQPAFAITDHGTVAGIIEGYKEAKSRGLHYVFGSEFYLVPDMSIKERENRHLILLAQDNEGYKNLLKLTTTAHRDGFYYKPRIDYEALKAHSRGLIATSACLGGILNQERQEEVLKWFLDVFGEKFFLELQCNQMPEQMDFNKRLLRLSRQYGVPLTVATDAHYIRREDADTHRKWISMAGGKDEYYSTDDYWLMSEKDVFDHLFYYLPDVVEAIDNTERIAMSCEVTLPFGEKHYPVFPVADKTERLKELCVEKCPPEYRAQLDEELSTLHLADYENYLLIVHDLVSHCKQEGIRVGPGRGSCVGSLTCYLLGITKLDPIQKELLFSRFCTLERVAPADIDLDFPKSKREQVLKYIRDRWGRTFQVRTHNYLGLKGAIQRAGQALKIPPAEVDAISKDVSTLDKYPELKQLADAFTDLINNFGCHASAVVVFPDEPENWTAIERQGDVFVTSFDYGDLEAMGLLKLDILGLNTLDLLDNCMRLIGNTFDIDAIQDGDQFAYDLLCRGETAGVFQLESPGMTKLVTDCQPRCHEDLTALNALYRPGPKESGMIDMYVTARKQGKLSVLHRLPFDGALDDILDDTMGLLVYQEQIQLICQKLCGWSQGQGDLMRRAIAKKKRAEMDVLIPKFVSDGEANGYDRFEMEQMAQAIEKFADYCFNKSHSSAYAWLAYQTAYLKANYPLEFHCALLNSELGDSEKTAEYVEEARNNMGIMILPPDAIKSRHDWTIEESSLRVGLGAIKGVGSAQFTLDGVSDFESFIQANWKANRRVLAHLIQAGAFGGKEKDRLLEYLDWAKEYYARAEEITQKIVKYTLENNQRLRERWLGQAAEHMLKKFEYSGKYKNEELNERDVLGFTLEDISSKYDFSLTLRGRDIIGGEVTRFKLHQDKKGRQMAFVKVKDHRGDMHDLVMFSKNFRTLKEGGVYLLKIRDTQIIDAAEAKKKAG